MTETTTFPFPTVQDDAAYTEPDSDRRPFAVILGGGLLAVALVGGAVFAFSGGEQELPAPSTASAVTGATNAAPPAAAEVPQTVPGVNSESIARNPFEPKYVAPAPVVETPAEAPAADPAAVPPSVVVPEPDGALAPAPVLVTPPQAPAPTSPQAPPPAPAPREYRLVLTGVSTEGEVPTAQFTIDGAVFSVKATDIFGPQQQLLLRSLQQRSEDGQWTATIQVGDARPIDVVIGEAVFVQ